MIHVTEETAETIIRLLREELQRKEEQLKNTNADSHWLDRLASTDPILEGNYSAIGIYCKEAAGFKVVEDLGGISLADDIKHEPRCLWVEVCKYFPQLKCEIKEK